MHLGLDFMSIHYSSRGKKVKVLKISFRCCRCKASAQLFLNYHYTAATPISNGCTETKRREINSLD